ncbi:hypothetical protein ACO2Q8_16730 [Larkinella sp. VNQ87]|uniref:hypothetical protein n=1 Tax=Larkinella sp. VNQ87 TaxID=3400921 RepID=UPI003C0C18EF
MEAKPETKPARTVALYSWWKSKDGKRQFAVVDKQYKGVTADLRTVGIWLLEVGDPNAFYHALGDFWALVDKESLVEMKGGKEVPKAT